jgi:hypothetical protein
MNWLKYLVGFSALIIAGCAAYFSVTGLGVLFSGAAVSVMVMAGALEFAKLVAATYLKQEWENIKGFNKWYLTSAVALLMLITSAGIFGYLSNAFQSQSLKLQQVDREVLVYTTKIEQNTAQITQLNTQLGQLSSTQNTILDKGKVNSRLLRSIDQKDRQTAQINKKIEVLQTENAKNNEEINKIKTSNLDLEKEVGGFRFVAQTFNVSLNTAVNWFILMIVFVFDPLAIALVLAFNTKPKQEEQIEVEQIEVESHEPEVAIVTEPEPEEDIPTQNILSGTSTDIYVGEYFGKIDYTQFGHEYVPDMLDIPIPIESEQTSVELKNINMYKVSLIVPSYMRPERTQRVIDCILNQDFVGFEAYIVGDNCPFIQKLVDEGKQKEYAKIAESKGNKLAIFNMPIHYGGYGYQARNTCVKLAIGEYVMFMDNDDVIEPDHISNYYNAISKTENDLMYFNSWLDPIEVRGTRGKIRDTKMEEGMIGHAEIIVKSSLLKSLKPETPEYNHDWKYIKQMLDEGAIYEKSNNKPTYKIMGVGELRETLID